MAFTQSLLDDIISAVQEGAPTAATGTIKFNDPATAADTVTVNGVVITFGPGEGEIPVAATANLQATSLANFLSSSDDPLLTVATYSASTDTVTVTYKTTGTAGNDFTLAKNGADIVVSGAKLTGGIDGGPYDPGSIDPSYMDSDFESNVIALVASVEFILASGANPTVSDVTTARQRKVLKHMLSRLSQLVPTAANSGADDRVLVSTRLRDGAISLFNGMPRTSDI